MANLIKLLKPFASCDIGDALVRLKYPHGGYLDGLTMWSPHRAGTSGRSTSIIGPAVTVKMVEAHDNIAPRPQGHFADAAETGKIMFIHQPPGLPSACFGGLMATRARLARAAGVVVNGRFRDVVEIQGMGLPLFAKGVSILGSNTFTRASEINVPLQVSGDLWVNPGDLLVGDEDGVVVVPPQLVEQVAQICAERKAQDDAVLESLEHGNSMEEAMKARK